MQNDSLAFAIIQNYRIYTNYLSIAISGILHQVHIDGQEYPVHCISRTCKGRECYLASAECELMVAVYALVKFKNYLGFKELELVTNSMSLTELQYTMNLADNLARWSFFWQEL